MSRTLNLVDHLLATGRKFQELGRTHDARHALQRLAGFRDLPANVAEETQARLAELEIKYRHFRRARRHLTAALLHQPGSARYHYLLAGALSSGAKGDDERAAEHYRKSLELDPRQPRCLGEFGLLALRLGRTEEGLDALRRAVELAPDDPEAVGNLVEGLRQEGRVDEARTVLRAAQFRNPRDARLRKLKNDFEFFQLRQQQLARQRTRRPGEALEDGPVLLRFDPPADRPRTTKGSRKILRVDDPSTPGAPHLPGRQRRSDQKRAQ